jgi:peptidoglycan/xylan/chitin deacetylase (PgdA/CDA1 family)
LAHHYRPVSAAEVLRAKLGGVPLPGRAALVTFDDAYRDFREVAWPLLRARGVPAVLFVPTAYPSHPERRFWWDRLHQVVTRCGAHEVVTPLGSLSLRSREERRKALRRIESHLKSLPHDAAMSFLEDVLACLGEPAEDRAPGVRAGGDVLGWSELRELAQEGVTLAPHSRWHPLLTRCTEGRIRDEVRGSLEDLRRELGDVLPIFSYPDGSHDARVRQVLEEEGIELALTQDDGPNDLRTADPLRLCRTDVTRRTTLPVLRLRLQPWFAGVDRWRHRGRSMRGVEGEWKTSPGVREA